MDRQIATEIECGGTNLTRYLHCINLYLVQCKIEYTH